MRAIRSTVVTRTSILVIALARPAFAGDSAPRTHGPNTAKATSESSGIVGEAERWITAAAAGPTAASDPATPRAGTSYGAIASNTAERDIANARRDAQEPFASFTPSVSLVARDWRGSMRLVGSRTLLVDDLRPTASSRMVLGRVATDGRLSGFMHVGVGEWRIDTVMFPNARSYSETAGQIGAGFELRLSPELRLGGEALYTMLYRDLRYTSDEVAPRILAFVVAVDGRF
jgi:hypothetical protein